ncbi:hypothetical protein AB833_02985 [Chromatiales bacterium (ex Bugula neritina AB1)]|nr:hypothetical protein AB833_02985 [Chromatiales bacterium (ex Bugula neritina AB1)]
MSNLPRGGARKLGPEPTAKLRRSRAFLLFLLPMPMLILACVNAFGDVVSALGYAAGFALSMIAATLVRKGLDIEFEARRRKIVRRSSAIPYKALGAVVLGAGILIGANLGAEIKLVNSFLLALGALAGVVMVYGTDPSRSAPEMPAIGVSAEEVLEILEEAEAKILAIEAARSRIHNVELKDRLRSIVSGVREIMAIVEEDPRDLRRARKFLKVYLDGAQRVTEGYADTHTQGDTEELDKSFRSVLTTIETVIGEQKQKLLENNLTELDVQIEVLQLQLEKEGV